VKFSEGENMNNTQKRSAQTQSLVLLALLTAMVAILAYYGGFIKIGGLASISLTLIPVVIGATLCGPFAGACLGFVAAVMFFATPDAAFWLGLSVHGTIITVIVKGILSGLLAGLAYKLFQGINRYVAVILSAVVCPVVNTGLFALGSRLFFWSAYAEMGGGNAMMILMTVMIGFNFIAEIAANMICAPVIVRILHAAKIH
jgi:uncharacterized membrane protein